MKNHILGSGLSITLKLNNDLNIRVEVGHDDTLDTGYHDSRSLRVVGALGFELL